MVRKERHSALPTSVAVICVIIVAHLTETQAPW